MKIIKKLSIIFALTILLSICLTAFSACKDYDTFDYYYFSDEWGEFVRHPRTQITVSKDREYMYLKNGGATLGEDVDIDGRMVYLDDELKYYASEYFIAPVSAMKGQAIVDDNFNGKLMTKDFSYFDLKDGEILSESGEKKGEYTVKNNYVTIALDGERRAYMFMRISSEGESPKTVGLFDEFYAMIDVLADNVDNTGIVLDKSVLLVDSDDEIVPSPKTKGYKFKDVTYEVIDADGYELEIFEGGKYDLKIKKSKPSDRITIKITADGLERTYDFLPISVAYDKSLMVMRFVGDSIDFSNKLWYLYANLSPDNVSIRTVVVHGEDNCVLNGDVLTFTSSGVVVVKMIATINIGDDVYVMTDEASINVSERYID